MSKVLLVNPDIPMKRYLTQVEQFPNGALLLLGTILKNKGHVVKVVHMTADRVSLEQLEGMVRIFEPEVVGLTAVSFQSRTLRETSRAVKRARRKTKVVAGGSHISALVLMGYPVAEDYPDIDYFVRGEGDLVLSDIIEEEPTSNIIVTEPMDSLVAPAMDLGLVNINRFAGAYPPGPRAGMFVMGSRGCSFRCTFCSRSVFGKTVRYRDPFAVVNDAEKLAMDWGIKEVFFQDDTFNLNRAWAEEILGLIIARRLNKKLCFRTPCRVNEKLIDLDLLKLMREAGFWLIFYGVESGNQMMLDRMHKDTTLEEITRAFRLTREAGIKTEASFIVGLPGESKETILDSVKLWERILPDWCSFTRAVPFPGSDLYHEVKQADHLLMDSFDDIEVDKTLCRTEALTGEEIEKYAVMLGNMASKKKLWQLLRHPTKLVRVLSDLKDVKGIKRGIKQLWQLLHRLEL